MLIRSPDRLSYRSPSSILERIGRHGPVARQNLIVCVICVFYGFMVVPTAFPMASRVLPIVFPMASWLFPIVFPMASEVFPMVFPMASEVLPTVFSMVFLMVA